MKSMYRDLNTRYEGLRRELQRVDTDPLVKQHPQTRSAKRIEVLAEWHQYITPRLQQLRKEELPTYLAERRADTSRARENLRAGRRPDFNLQQQDGRVEPLNAEGLATVRHQALLTAFTELKVQQQIANKMQLYTLMTTEQLQSRVSAYERAAKAGDLDSFPYADFAADVEILPVLLQARATKDDPRAGFALEQFQNVEATLLRTAGFDPEPVDGTAESLTLDQIEEAVSGLLVNGHENLRPLEEIMDPIAREVERQNAREAQAVMA